MRYADRLIPASCASVVELVWGSGMQEVYSSEELQFHSLQSCIVLLLFTKLILVSNIFNFLSQHKDF